MPGLAGDAAGEVFGLAAGVVAGVEAGVAGVVTTTFGFSAGVFGAGVVEVQAPRNAENTQKIAASNNDIVLLIVFSFFNTGRIAVLSRTPTTSATSPAKFLHSRSTFFPHRHCRFS